MKDAEQRPRQPGLDLGLRPAAGAKAARAAGRGTELRAAGALVGTGSPGCLSCGGREPDPQATFPAPSERDQRRVFTASLGSPGVPALPPGCRGSEALGPALFGVALRVSSKVFRKMFVQ